jgi:hypothetical protein
MGVCLGLSALVLRDSATADAFLLIFQAAILMALITVLERRGRSIGTLKGSGFTVHGSTVGKAGKVQDVMDFGFRVDGSTIGNARKVPDAEDPTV